MAITGKFGADFDDFYSAVVTAEAHLKSFETNSAKVETRLNAVSDAFSGRRIVQEATIAVKAVEEIGGVTNLTAAEQTKLNALIGDAIVKYGAMGKSVPDDMQAMYDATKQVEEPTGILSTGMIALGTSIGQMAADSVIALGKLAVDGVGKVASAFADLVLKGGDVSDIAGNFDSLATATGQVSSTMLGTLREATHSTISDFDLMKSANEQMAAGLILSDGDMRTLAAGAFNLAQATGTDVKEGLDQMSQAMITGNAKSVQLLTGKLDLESAERRYALALGKTRDELTPAEGLYARQQAILEGVAAASLRVGEQTDGISEKVEQARVKWDNFYDSLAKTVAESPVLTAGLDAVMTSLQNAFGGDQQALIDAIAKGINQAAIYAVDMAIQIVELARSGIEAFGTLKTPIDLITVAITEVVSATAGGIASMLELAASAPGVGSAFQDQATAARAAATEYGNLATKAHEQLAADRALATGQGPVHDALTATVTVLGATKSAMEAANLSSRAAGTALDDHAKSATASGTATLAASAQHDADAASLKKQEDALKLANAEQKKMNEALVELSSVGESWVDTLMSMDGGVADMARAYLDAGAKVGAVQTALHLTDGEMKAITESVKAQGKTLGDLAKMQEDWGKAQAKSVLDAQALWAEYDKIRDAQTKTATDQQIAEVERWKQAQIDAHDKDLTLTKEVYDAIEATAAAKLDAIRVDWSALSTASTTSMQQTADKARATYEEALTGSHNLTTVQIENFRRVAEQAQVAADNYANAFVGAADTVSGAVTTAADKSIAANDRVAASATTALDKITGVYTSAGASGGMRMGGTVGGATKPAGMSESEWQLMLTNPHAWEAQHGYDWQHPAGSGTFAMLEGRAAGGPVTAGTAYVVGERGPEVFTPRTSGTIAPNGTAAGGTTVSVVVQVSGAIIGTANDLARLVGDAMIGRLRQQGVQLPAAV